MTILTLKNLCVNMCYVHIPFKAKSITNFKNLLKKKIIICYKAWISLSRENPLTRQHIVQAFLKGQGFHRRVIIRQGKEKKNRL